MKRALMLSLSAALLAATQAQGQIPIVLPTIANSDFETGAAGFVNFPGYTSPTTPGNPPEITSWAGSGNRGVNPYGGGAGAPFRDNGNNTTNVAFMQGNGSTIGQTITGFEPGENYRISFDYNSRNSGSGAPQVGVTATIGGGSFIDSSVPPVGGSNSYYTGNILFTPATDTATLDFTANVTSGDKTLLVDNVRVFRNGPAISDNGFENPVQPASDWRQANGAGTGSLVGSAWNITGGGGITRNTSPFQNGRPAPEGDQHALIQQNGSFSQIVSGFEPGAEYTLSLLTMARQGQNFGNDLEVLLDAGMASEIVLLDVSEIIFDSFTELESLPFLAENESYELTIRSTLDGGNLSPDRTTFFDNVFFNQQSTALVPEPASIAIWLLAGLSLCGAASTRRRRRCC